MRLRERVNRAARVFIERRHTVTRHAPVTHASVRTLPKFHGKILAVTLLLYPRSVYIDAVRCLIFAVDYRIGISNVYCDIKVIISHRRGTESNECVIV